MNLRVRGQQIEPIHYPWPVLSDAGNYGGMALKGKMSLQFSSPTLRVVLEHLCKGFYNRNA
jgi:hypothetical protein